MYRNEFFKKISYFKEAMTLMGINLTEFFNEETKFKELRDTNNNVYMTYDPNGPSDHCFFVESEYELDPKKAEQLFIVDSDGKKTPNIARLN